MSQKNQKNLIIVGGVVVALLVGSVLLGGFTKSEPAETETTPAVGACPASGCGGCPTAKADSATCAMASDGEKAEGSCCGKPCPPDCPKPCCAEEAPVGCCGEPKPCCPSGPPAGCCGEPKTTACCDAEEAAAQ